MRTREGRTGRRPRGLVAVGVTVAAAGIAWVVAGLLPLPPLDPNGFLSSYGVADNRHLLLRYAGLLIAAVAGPWVALAIERWGGRSASPTQPVAATVSLFPALGLVLAMPLVLGFLFLGPGVSHHPLNGHELVHLGYLSEIEHGRLLNVDTRVTYGPLLGYSLWAFMKLASFDLVGFRWYWSLGCAVGVAAVWLLSGREIRHRGLWWLLLGYLLLGTVARLFLPDANGVNGGLWGWGNFLRLGWPVLFILGFAGPFARSRAAGWRVAAGSVLALGIAYAQETASGGLAALCFLLWITLPRRSARPFFRDAALALGSAVLVMGLLLLPAIARGALREFLEATFEIPRLFLQGGGNLEYPRFLGADRHGHPAWAGYYLFPMFSLIVLAWAWWSSWVGRSPGVVLPLAAYAAISFFSVLVRADGLHLLNVAAAPIVLAFLVLDRIRDWSTQRRAVRYLMPAVVALPLAVWGPGLPHLAAGIWGKVRHPAPGPPPGWVRIPGDRGGVWTPPGDWFDSPQWGSKDDPETPAFIAGVSGAGPVYIRGNKASLYYFLADVPCAASFTDLSSQCLTPEAYGRLFQELAEKPPTMVFLMETSVGPRPTPQDGFRYFGVHHGLEVYRRTDLPVSEELLPESP